MRLTSSLIVTLLILTTCSLDVFSQNSKWKNVDNIDGCLFRIDTTAGGFYDPGCDSRARWDFFIIYNDYTFSSTRTYFSDPDNQVYSSETIEPLYTSKQNNFDCKPIGQEETVLKFSDPMYNLTYAVTKPMSYFYISNIYDGDEPPKRASLTQNGITQNSSGLIIPVSHIDSVSKGNGIFANHNIVRGNELILAVDTDLFKKNQNYSLTFPNNLDTANFPNTTQYVFPSMSTTNAASNGSNSIRTIGFTVPDPKPAHIFFSLQAHTSISNESVRFEVEISGDELFTEELVLDAHDPNYIQLIDYCKPKTNCHKADYKINFQNNGDAQPREIKVELKFRDGLIRTVENARFTGCHIHSNRGELSAEVIQDNNTLTFKTGLLQCQACKDNTKRAESNGQLFFDMELTSPLNDQNVEHELAELTPEFAAVYFDNNMTELSFSSRACAFDQSNPGCITPACDCGDTEGGPDKPIWIYILAGCIIIALPIIWFFKKS